MNKEKWISIVALLAGILVFVFPVLVIVVVGGYLIIVGLMGLFNKTPDEVMGQLQEQVQTLEGKISDLLKKKPDTPEKKPDDQ